MKTRLLVLVSLLVAFFLATWVWLQYPKVENPELIEAAMKSADERFVAVQAQADNPEENGYLTPDFLPFWGRVGNEQENNPPIGEVFTGWIEYSTPGLGEKVDHPTLQEGDDQKYAQALAEFEKVSPALLTAFRKPMFVTPEERISLQNITFNLIAVRRATYTLVGLAEARTAQGEPKEATEILVTIVQFGSNLIGSDSLIHDMYGIAIQGIGSAGISVLVDPGQALGTEFSRDMTERLVDSVPPKEHIVRAFETELLLGHLAIQDAKENGGNVDEFPLTWLPGFMDREDRIYQNVMAIVLTRVGEGKDLGLPRSFSEPSFSDWFSGRTGMVAQILVPGFLRAVSHARFNRARQTGLATAFGIMTFREKEGRLPNSLDELSRSGIPVVAEGDRKSMTYQANENGAALSVPFKPIEGEPQTIVSSYQGTGWFEVENDKIVFHL